MSEAGSSWKGEAVKQYKIRNKDTGLFSTGGAWPKFTKNGKVWQRERDLKRHFHQVYEVSVKYKDCEVVIYDVVEESVLPCSKYQNPYEE